MCVFLIDVYTFFLCVFIWSSIPLYTCRLENIKRLYLAHTNNNNNSANNGSLGYVPKRMPPSSVVYIVLTVSETTQPSSRTAILSVKCAQRQFLVATTRRRHWSFGHVRCFWAQASIFRVRRGPAGSGSGGEWRFCLTRNWKSTTCLVGRSRELGGS